MVTVLPYPVLLLIARVKPGFQPHSRGTETLMAKLEPLLSVEQQDLLKNIVNFYHASSNWLLVTWFLYGKSRIHHSTKALHFKAVYSLLSRWGKLIKSIL